MWQSNFHRISPNSTVWLPSKVSFSQTRSRVGDDRLLVLYWHLCIVLRAPRHHRIVNLKRLFDIELERFFNLGYRRNNEHTSVATQYGIRCCFHRSYRSQQFLLTAAEATIITVCWWDGIIISRRLFMSSRRCRRLETVSPINFGW
jgi:hypothetical protein